MKYPKFFNVYDIHERLQAGDHIYDEHPREDVFFAKINEDIGIRDTGDEGGICVVNRQDGTTHVITHFYEGVSRWGKWKYILREGKIYEF